LHPRRQVGKREVVAEAKEKARMRLGAQIAKGDAPLRVAVGFKEGVFGHLFEPPDSQPAVELQIDRILLGDLAVPSGKDGALADILVHELLRLPSKAVRAGQAENKGKRAHAVAVVYMQRPLQPQPAGKRTLARRRHDGIIVARGVHELGQPRAPVEAELPSILPDYAGGGTDAGKRVVKANEKVLHWIQFLRLHRRQQCDADTISVIAVRSGKEIVIQLNGQVRGPVHGGGQLRILRPKRMTQ
jgi:hypothetical protein